MILLGMNKCKDCKFWHNRYPEVRDYDAYGSCYKYGWGATRNANILEKNKMSKRLTKKEYASVARKLLLNIYGENIDAAATIINAEANVLNDEKGGEETLAYALANARDFIQEIINGLIYQKQDNGKRKREKHIPRGC